MVVTILGKPGKPGGPLKVADVTKNGCKLSWNPPEDDGGSPVEYYEIEKLDPLTGQWLPCGKSNGTEANITGLQEDVPTKPGKPQLKDWDKDFVELAWAPPESDGGAPVQKYVVQMRDKDERNWVDVLTVPGDSLFYFYQYFGKLTEIGHPKSDLSNKEIKHYSIFTDEEFKLFQETGLSKNNTKCINVQ
uniref:Fibronectin type-III domain-containing protein n=1 Tax=Rhodnius prolixus TaxID=13249 RepID=T1IEM7_RHOPR